MSTDRNPFSILGITPDAELVVITAAYRALARRYHPDLNPDVSANGLNRRMIELNWAKEELERHLEGWRKRSRSRGTESFDARTAHTGTTKRTKTSSRTTGTTLGGMVRPDPEVVFLRGVRGSSVEFRVAATGVSPEEVRARFKSGVIDVRRLEPQVGFARFEVMVIEDFASDLSDNVVEIIDVVASGHQGGKLFVSVAPISPRVLSQKRGDRVAPTRHATSKARISFGKHRARTFEEIAVEEPGYLRWMMREGAGSRIERESAQMALEELKGGLRLPPRQRRAQSAIRTEREPKGFAALPDPARPGGLLQILKGLFSPKKSSY
jgi:hypothetical protein